MSLADSILQTAWMARCVSLADTPERLAHSAAVATDRDPTARQSGSSLG